LSLDWSASLNFPLAVGLITNYIVFAGRQVDFPDFRLISPDLTTISINRVAHLAWRTHF
jgi:hypothetical protein